MSRIEISRPIAYPPVRARAVWRLLRVALHLSRGLLTVALVYPHIDASRKLTLMKQWSAKLLGILGIRLTWSGEVPPAGMLVSNHISFVDVFAINAIVPMSFVAKHEVRAWPLIGWLCQHTGTLFLERGSRGAAQRARKDLVAHLLAGKRVAVFPEGTTSNGDGVLPFHSAMFQGAIDAAARVTPVAIRYHDRNGARSEAAAFVGEMSLVECLWSIACAEGLTVAVTLLPAHTAGESDRRHLSAHVHKAIGHYLQRTVSHLG